jgi:hypothetical protein
VCTLGIQLNGEADTLDVSVPLFITNALTGSFALALSFSFSLFLSYTHAPLLRKLATYLECRVS